MKMRIGRKLGSLSLLGAGLILGHLTGGGATTAQTPPASGVKQASASIPAPANEKRVVAYIYGNIPLYREDFGEFLIARKGAERFELYINKMIIEHAAVKRGITVTDAEIEALIETDRGQQFKREDFEKIVQQQYGSSLYEWKSDVIRPRIILSKMGQERMASVKIDEADIKKEYETRHGRCIKVKIIKWQKADLAIATAAFEKLRNNPEEFDRAACKQIDPSLAANGGIVKPFSRGSTKDEVLEAAAFLMKEGDYSPIVKTGGCLLMMRCVGYEEGPAGNFEAEKAAIEQMLRGKRLDSEVVEILKALRKEADPKDFFTPPKLTDTDLKAATENELKGTGLIDNLSQRSTGTVAK